MEWYYAVDNEQKGPVSEEEFKRLVDDGIITESTLVWNQDMEDWKPFGSTIEVVNAVPPLPDELPNPETHEAGEVKRVKEYSIRFSGKGGEYFRIWIVNLFFTILTLGIYAAWAKVRNRQYLYANSSLAGDTFEFLGNPVAILRGNIVIAILFATPYLLKNLDPIKASIGLAIFYVIFFAILPFLIYKSMKFLARYSSWRNIRFTFTGTLKESYFIFFLLPVLILLLWSALGYGLIGNPINNNNLSNMPGNILGLIIIILISGYFISIYILFRMKKYFFSHMSYGQAENTFTGTPGKFYGTYTIAGALYIATMVVFSILFGLIGAATMKSSPQEFVPVMLIVTYIPIICGFLGIKMFIYTKINNYCWSELQIDNVTFRSRYETIPMVGIMVTNVLAIIFSLGLMIPWAKIRMTRYKLENISIFTDDNFENFRAAETDDVSALGDSAMDMFDFDISL